MAREFAAAGRSGDFSEWVAQCNQRKATMHRKTHFGEVPIKPQRV